MKTTPNTERRSGKDRRATHIPFYKHLLFKGNRQKLRRSEDGRQITVLDRYKPTLFIAIMIVVSLSLIDATLTLVLLDQGAVELNPIMRYYLTLGPAAFVIVKYGITVSALLLMVVLNTLISARYGIGPVLFQFSALVFGSVVVWELYLLSHL